MKNLGDDDTEVLWPNLLSSFILLIHTSNM